MDVSVTETPPAAPGVAEAGFAAGVATVLSGEAVEAATAAQEAAQDAAVDAQRAADHVTDAAIDAGMAAVTAEAAHERIDQLWESFNDFREDLVDVMNESRADVDDLDQQLPPLAEKVDQLEDQVDGDKTPPTPKPRKGKLDAWFGGR